MGKLILGVLIVGGAYAWHEGYIGQWLDDLVDKGRETAAARRHDAGSRSGAPSDQQPGWAIQEHAPAPRPHPAMATDAGQGKAEACATARRNVQHLENWQRQGGSYGIEGQTKPLSENQSFDELASNRQFIEDNCR